MASLARPTYRFSLALVPSRDEIPLVLNARHMVGAGVEVGVQRGAYSEYLLERWGGMPNICGPLACSGSGALC